MCLLLVYRAHDHLCQLGYSDKCTILKSRPSLWKSINKESRNDNSLIILFDLFIYLSLCHLSQLKVDSRVATWLQGSQGLGVAGRTRPALGTGRATHGCLKVSLDGAGFETCFLLPVPGGHRSLFGAKDKAQNRTRPSTVDLDLPYVNNGSKWVRKK